MADYCPSCNCSCFGNVFLCDAPHVGTCRVCGHGVKTAWLIAEEKKYNEFHAPTGSAGRTNTGEIKEEVEQKESTKMGMLSKIKPKKNEGGERREFLRVEDFPRSGEMTVTIDELREAPAAMKYSNFLLDIHFASDKFTIGLKDDAVLLYQLMEELGGDEKRWKGKKINLVVAKGKYINLARPERSGKHGSTKKKATKRKVQA